jgi:hypothetical protein
MSFFTDVIEFTQECKIKNSFGYIYRSFMHHVEYTFGTYETDNKELFRVLCSVVKV